MQQVGIRDLETLGRLYVTYDPELRKAVGRAMERWEAFCALPNEQKVRFGYTPDAKVSGNGYELKLDGIDRKENCHLRVEARKELIAMSADADPMLGPAFVEAALEVNERMTHLIRTFAEHVETEYGIEGFARDVMAYQPKWLLRFLHYFGDHEPYDEIAAPHTDKGGFTLHLYESHPGVEYLTHDTRQWKELPLAHDETVIFPGMGLHHRSRCKLQGLTHRVVATEETARTGRFSAVCFFNFDNVRFYNKTKFGSMQQFPPGHFYGMPFAEFDQYFID